MSGVFVPKIFRIFRKHLQVLSEKLHAYLPKAISFQIAPYKHSVKVHPKQKLDVEQKWISQLVHLLKLSKWNKPRCASYLLACCWKSPSLGCLPWKCRAFFDPKVNLHLHPWSMGMERKPVSGVLVSKTFGIFQEKSSGFGWKSTCLSPQRNLHFKWPLEKQCQTASKTKPWCGAKLNIITCSTPQVN